MSFFEINALRDGRVRGCGGGRRVEKTKVACPPSTMGGTDFTPQLPGTFSALVRLWDRFSSAAETSGPSCLQWRRVAALES